MTPVVGIDLPRSARRWRPLLWGGAALLCLLPLLAMQITDEVDWSAGDFLVFGVLLFAACGTFELSARWSVDRAYRAGVGVAVATAFFVVWVTLAVGIIGREDNPANLMYFAVPLVGFVGAAGVRFRASGMVLAMRATAVAQALVALVALLLGSVEGSLASLLLVALWLAASALSGKAARRMLPVEAAKRNDPQDRDAISGQG